MCKGVTQETNMHAHKPLQCYGGIPLQICTVELTLVVCLLLSCNLDFLEHMWSVHNHNTSQTSSDLTYATKKIHHDEGTPSVLVKMPVRVTTGNIAQERGQ